MINRKRKKMTRQAEEGVKREQPVPLKSGVCEQAPLDWAGRYFYAECPLLSARYRAILKLVWKKNVEYA
jgi:hypothetical protein